MIAVTPSTLVGTPVSASVGALANAALCMVRLIDRRTGQTHRINRTAVELYTCQPERVAQDLLRNRDPRHWETRIEHLGIAAFATGGQT